MSIAYGIAARLVFGGANLTAYTRTNRHDPRIRQAMDLVEFEIDNGLHARRKELHRTG